MITAQQLQGTGVALVTPFDSNNNIDLHALGELVNYVLNGDIDFLVALGTTAETPTLSNKEKLEVINTIKETNAGRVPLVLGLGGNDTAQMVDTINKTNFDGVDAILSVTPFYNKPNQNGLYQHYKAISEVSPLPIILYNVPSRTGSNLSAKTCIRLASDFDNIIAVKEASGDFGQIMDIIKHKPVDFMVLSGDDATTLPLISVGGNGVISVIANAYPAEFTAMVKHALNSEYSEAQKIHYRLIDLIKDIFAEGNPAGIKAILSYRDIIKNQLRLPLVPISDTLDNKLKTHFDTL